MRSRNSASFATPIYARRDATSVSWGYFILTVVCACVLAAGFFLAAKQHFNTMDYGMKNSSLRKQIEDLQTENRRLLLAREYAMSPAEIKRSAKSLGFRDRGEVAVLSAKDSTNGGIPSVAVKSAVPVQADHTSDSPKAVKAYSLQSATKVDAIDKSVAKIVMQRPTKDEDNRLRSVTR